MKAGKYPQEEFNMPRYIMVKLIIQFRRKELVIPRYNDSGWPGVKVQD